MKKCKKRDACEKSFPQAKNNFFGKISLKIKAFSHNSQSYSQLFTEKTEKNSEKNLFF